MVSPSFCNANSTGGSTTSTPTGSLWSPRIFEFDFDLAGDVLGAPHLGGHRAAHQRDARARPLAQPVAVLLVVPGGGAEVPEDRLVVLRQQREPADLVLRPGPDVRGGDVADVVHVEAEHGAHLRLGEQVLDPCEPLAPQPIEVDPALPVHRHRAVCLDCHGSAPELSPDPITDLKWGPGVISFICYTARAPRRTPGVRSARSTSSSDGENGIGTCIAPIRRTGASR